MLSSSPKDAERSALYGACFLIAARWVAMADEIASVTNSPQHALNVIVRNRTFGA